MTVANHENVCTYLQKECGIKQKQARELVQAYTDVIQKGARLGSFAFYVAGEVLKAFGETFEGGEISDEWEGWDPDWVEPSEDDDDDSDEPSGEFLDF